MLKLEDLAGLAEQYGDAARAQVAEFAIGHRFFAFNSQPAIMGVINLSRDSWYRESVCPGVEQAIQRGSVLQAQGADVVDIGAESTLAQAERVSGAQQAAALIPVIKALRGAGVLISVETYDAGAARLALETGAHVINLTGLAQAAEVYRMAAAHDAAAIVCHLQGPNVREVGDLDLGADPVGDIYDHFAREIETATRAGLTKLFIDPGLGFYYRNLRDSAARVRYQMRVFLETFRLRKLGFPVCHALPHAFEYFGEEVRCAEPFFAVLAALGKTDLFRTHEVPRIKAVLQTLRVY